MSTNIASRFQSNLEAIQRLLRDSGVRLAYLFGSVAKGTERLDSDLDVAVLLDDRIPRDRYGDVLVQLTTDLIGLTHTNDVDVVILNEAPPLLAFNVLSTGRVFLGEHDDRVDFEFDAIRRYIDTRPIRAMLDEDLARRLREIKPRRGEGVGPW
ncbi:MAG: nucleotidyltransferase domain-containing protein [Planctomycetes bacterium]|nr:nucleotidyltransferase domain-containing protein [Planctomycetota bacterium]MBI3844278.1 nucleotidyltransferase domain-containing protein [Planctomycetota bacterium]